MTKKTNTVSIGIVTLLTAASAQARTTPPAFSNANSGIGISSVKGPKSSSLFQGLKEGGRLKTLAMDRTSDTSSTGGCRGK